MLAPIAALVLASFAVAGVQKPDSPREPGLSFRWYFIGEPLDSILQLVPGQTPNLAELVPTIDYDSARDGDRVAGGKGDFEDTYLLHVHGWLNVPAEGTYALKLTSDDGSKLWLDGHVAIDNDGLHSPRGVVAEIKLTAGAHVLDVWYFESYGGAELKLEWKVPGAAKFEVVPASAFTTGAGEVRVTAPGPKRVIKRLAKGRPGDGLPLDSVHPAFDKLIVRPEGFEPKVGGIDWLDDGRMVLTTWDPTGAVYLLDGVQGDDRAKITTKRIASGLAEPLGIQVVGKRIFVLQKQELTELIDHDGDMVADEYHCLCSAWMVSPNFHEFAFGLVEKDGWLYFNLAIAIDPGGKSTRPQVPGRGSTIRVSMKDGTYETVAHGLRTPNGIGLGPDGEIFLTDNQGDWLPSSKLLRLEKGAFYGSRAVLLEGAASLTVTPPVLWLPQNEIGNSPSNPALIPDGVGPYGGQMCHGDVTHGGVKRDFIEVVDGVWQGAVFRWTQGLEAGVNRISFGPDKAMYCGGIGSNGNWGQEGKGSFGLERLRWNKKSVFEMLALRARSNGFEIEFTEPLREGAGWDPENWRVEDWKYVPTEQYGGPKVDERVLVVKSASVSADRRRVFLAIPGLMEGSVVYVHVVGPVVNVSGGELWSTEAWYTLNRIPKDSPGIESAAPRIEQNVLTDAEKRAGWQLLFDGASTNSWRGYKQSSLPAGWKALKGALVRAEGGGDIVTVEEYADFELAIDWKISKGGNSGVMFHVTEDRSYPWETGAEMQVLDNDGHPDGANPLTSAGSNYALHAPERDVTRPIGLWNSARLLVKGSHVEHWLNGTKTAQYELWSPEWKALVTASKFAAMPDYGARKNGRIVLQDHGDPVEFRNIKIRRL